MHFLGAYLNFERLAVPAHDRSMQRLIEIWAWDRNIILDAARHRLPQVMQNSQNRIAIAHTVGDYPDGNEIEHFVYADLLPLHLIVDAVDAFGAAFQAGWNLMLLEFLGDDAFGLSDKIQVHGPARLNQRNGILVCRGIEEAKGEILELAADFCHAQSVCQRSVNFQRFQGDPFAAIRRQILQRAHIVQAIRQFDEQHPDIADHRQQHLAEIFRLFLLTRRQIDLRNFCDAVHQLVDLVPELLPELFRAHQGVFQHVVQEPRGNGHSVQLEFCEDIGNFERMRQIGLTVHPQLPFVVFSGGDITPLNQFGGGVRMIAAKLLGKVFITYHGFMRTLYLL